MNPAKKCRWPWQGCPRKVDKNNRFFCSFHFKNPEIPRNHHFDFFTWEKLREFRRLYKKAIKAFEAELTKRAIIPTTSLETLTRYPNAIMVSQRYAKFYIKNKKVRYFPRRMND